MKNHVVVCNDLHCIRDMPEYQEILNMKAMEVAREDIKTQDEPADYRTEIVEVPFSKEGGVTKVKCTINDLPLHFVFDTGAADVTMSMVEANFMLK